MENNNKELSIRKLSRAQLKVLQGTFFLFDNADDEVFVDQLEVRENLATFAITQKGGAVLSSRNAAKSLAPDPADIAIQALGDIVVAGFVRKLSTPLEFDSYVGRGVRGRIIPADAKPVMYFGGLFMFSEELACRSAWAVALQIARSLNVSAVVATQDRDFPLVIGGEQLWWRDEAKANAPFRQERPDDAERLVGVKVVSSECISSALEELQKQGISVSAGPIQALGLLSQP